MIIGLTAHKLDVKKILLRWLEMTVTRSTSFVFALLTSVLEKFAWYIESFHFLD